MPCLIIYREPFSPVCDRFEAEGGMSLGAAAIKAGVFARHQPFIAKVDGEYYGPSHWMAICLAEDAQVVIQAVAQDGDPQTKSGAVGGAMLVAGLAIAPFAPGIGIGIAVGGAAMLAGSLVKPPKPPTPEDRDAGRQVSVGNLQNKLATVRDPIPETFGRNRWMPPLVSVPVCREIGTERQVYEFLLCLGEGSYEQPIATHLNDILVDPNGTNSNVEFFTFSTPESQSLVGYYTQVASNAGIAVPSLADPEAEETFGNWQMNQYPSSHWTSPSAAAVAGNIRYVSPTVREIYHNGAWQNLITDHFFVIVKGNNLSGISVGDIVLLDLGDNNWHRFPTRVAYVNQQTSSGEGGFDAALILERGLAFAGPIISATTNQQSGTSGKVWGTVSIDSLGVSPAVLPGDADLNQVSHRFNARPWGDTGSDGKLQARTEHITWLYRNVGDPDWILAPADATAAAAGPLEATGRSWRQIGWGSDTPIADLPSAIDPTNDIEVLAVRLSPEADPDEGPNQLQWLQTYGRYTGEAFDTTQFTTLRMWVDLAILSEELRSISVEARRRLPTWNGNDWNTMTTTRSPSWAIAHILRRTYAADPYEMIDITSFQALETARLADGHAADLVVDAVSTRREIVQQLAQAVRAQAIIERGRDILVRDAPNNIISKTYTPATMMPDTLRIEKSTPDQDEPDGIEATYRDSTTWSDASVVRTHTGTDDATNPEPLDLPAITIPAQAASHCRFLANQRRYRRDHVSFTVSSEGMLQRPGDRIWLAHDLPDWGAWGVLDAWSSPYLTSTEPIDWAGLSGVMTIGIRHPDGSLWTQGDVIAGPDAFTIELDQPGDLPAEIIDAINSPDPSVHPQFVVLSQEKRKQLIVLRLSPVGDDRQVQLECVVDDPRVYDGV
jgi:hypothetical protein